MPANILKPALARGDLQCVGATTLNEYRKIEKDQALERRFAPVFVDQPSVEDCNRDPARPQASLRRAPQPAHHRRSSTGSSATFQPLHQPTASCPTRLST